MKRLIYLMMAVALICSASVFTSCSKDDNPVTPDLNLSEKIIGMWMRADVNGQASLTNEKKVYTFVSTTKAYLSASFSRPVVPTVWADQLEADVAIDGNKITVTSHTNEHETVVEEYIVTDINDKEFTANRKLTVTFDGTVRHTANEVFRLTKQTADYREAILGTWEGKVTSSEGSEYDDGETHRWEYKADGTYVYYSQNEEGEWVPSGDEISEYFVDGTLLCTRWGNNEQENREWWEIASIKDGVMKWKALRQKEDGTTFTATFEMKKVE